MSYTKLFSHIVTSSIWSEDDQTRILWITMLALSDKYGEVMASIPGLAKVAGLSIEATEKGLNKFMSPDQYSRTPDEEGKRIQVVDGGWAIINYAKHRRMASIDEQREKNAARQKRFRDKGKAVTDSNGKSRKVTDESRTSNGQVTDQTYNAEADASAKSRSSKMLSDESISELKKTYCPLGVNVVFEVNKAKRWIEDHPERRLTVNFMKSWLERQAKNCKPVVSSEKLEVVDSSISPEQFLSRK